MGMRKVLLSTLGLVLTAGAAGAFARVQAAATPQQDSVAEAARQARAQEKKEPKSAKVYTNDNITEVKGVVSVVGPPPPAPPAQKATPPAGSTAAAKPQGSTAAAQNAAKPAAKGESYWRQKFADARRTLADDSKELDILQREYNLKQQQYYSNPNVALQQQYNRSDLDKTQQQINAKKQDVAKDTQAISNLEDELRQAGGDPGWGRAQ
jgi:hypothetical protein